MSTNTNGRVGDVGRAVREAFISPNVADSNSEPANLVDVGDRIASAIFELADAQREQAKVLDHFMQVYRHYAGGGR